MTDTYIIESENNYRYNLDVISEFNDEQQQSVMEFPLPESTATENMLFRLDGQRNEIRIAFAIVNDGTDKSAGTYTSTIKTIAEQIEYLKKHIFTEKASTYWTLTDSKNFPSGVTGSISNLKIRRFESNPNYAEGSFTFIIGEVSS